MWVLSACLPAGRFPVLLRLEFYLKSFLFEARILSGTMFSSFFSNALNDFIFTVNGQLVLR